MLIKRHRRKIQKYNRCSKDLFRPQRYLAQNQVDQELGEKGQYHIERNCPFRIRHCLDATDEYKERLRPI